MDRTSCHCGNDKPYGRDHCTECVPLYGKSPMLKDLEKIMDDTIIYGISITDEDGKRVDPLDFYKKEEMSKGHYHEMGHTAYVFGDMVEKHLVESYDDPELKKKCEKAAELLHEVYQEAMEKAIS